LISMVSQAYVTVASDIVGSTAYTLIQPAV
jgi:hypothetical protein